MSEFKTKSITTKGMELLSKALSGEQLEFTRIEMGSGNFEGDIGSTEALVEVRQSLPINKIIRKGSQVTLSTSLKIEDITTPFEWTEIGVYARGEDNVEVLYMYGYTTNSSYISKDSLNEKLINVTVLVASTTQVTAVIDKSLVYLTAEALKEHENDRETHQDIRASVEEIQRQVEGLDVSWEGIQNKPTGFQPIDHTHTKAQITDFPSSLPANGGNADTVGGKQFNWSFGTKAPTHLWGSEGSSTEQYVYQPSQVSVGHAVNSDKIGNVSAQNIAVYLGSNPSTSIINNPAHHQNYDCWVHSTQATALGLPDAGNWHLSYKKHLNVDGYGTQIAMPYGRNEMYMRSSSGKVWTRWERLGGMGMQIRASNHVKITYNIPSMDVTPISADNEKKSHRKIALPCTRLPKLNGSARIKVTTTWSGTTKSNASAAGKASGYCEIFLTASTFLTDSHSVKKSFADAPAGTSLELTQNQSHAKSPNLAGFITIGLSAINDNGYIEGIQTVQGGGALNGTLTQCGDVWFNDESVDIMIAPTLSPPSWTSFTKLTMSGKVEICYDELNV